MVKSVKKEKKAVAEETPADESALVMLKKENAKVLEKSIKEMTSAVKESLDLKQVALAAKALQKYEKDKKKGKSLLSDENAAVHLSFTMTKVPKNPSPKPIQVKLDNPFNSEKNMTRVCLFVKDPEEDFKNLLDQLKLPCIADAIGFDRLKREFKQYKDKRALIADFDFFLADLRIYKMLPEVLGKEFYQRKVYPAPIKMHGFDNKELEKQLNNAAACTYFMPGNGPNYSLRIGRINQSDKDLARNTADALAQALGNLACWDEGIDFGNV